MAETSDPTTEDSESLDSEAEESETADSKTEGPAPTDSGTEGSLLSPEAVVMLPLAVIVDVIDFFIASLFIVDIIALLLFGSWMYLRSGQATISAKSAKALKMARTMRWLRPLLIIIECIPIVGMLPCWALVVYFELKQ